jgi:hypothetical protein
VGKAQEIRVSVFWISDPPKALGYQSGVYSNPTSKWFQFIVTPTRATMRWRSIDDKSVKSLTNG